jgi:pimeloyl-ACP methyl ester carboxylesterase
MYIFYIVANNNKKKLLSKKIFHIEMKFLLVHSKQLLEILQLKIYGVFMIRTFMTLILSILFLTGCATKSPITMQNRLKMVSLPDIDLHSVVSGSGEDLLLLHGFGSSSSSFRYITPSLSKKFKVTALDLKGFGKSPKPDDGNYSVYDQYLLVKRYILKNDIKNPRIIGHSIGGGVAMLLALDPDIGVKKMVLLDTPAYKQDLPKLLRYANIPVFGKLGFYLLGSHYEVMEGYRYAFYDDSKIPKEMVDELASDLSSKNGKYAFLEANRELIPDDIEKLVKRYKEITTPTLIIWGYEDVVIRRSRAYKLHRDLLNSTLKFIYHCGHLPQEEKPKKTLKLLEDFL